MKGYIEIIILLTRAATDARMASVAHRYKPVSRYWY